MAENQMSDDVESSEQTVFLLMAYFLAMEFRRTWKLFSC